MPYGLNTQILERIRGVFACHPTVIKAVLYGSRAKGTHKTGSDIDLTLYGNTLTQQDLSTLDDELDDLLLPYTIDLSLFHALAHAPLREHIERVGVVLYARAENCGEASKSPPCSLDIRPQQHQD